MLHCCATPPSVLGVLTSSDQPPPAPAPQAWTDGNWAPPTPSHVGGQVPYSAQPTWGLSRPCILLELLSPSRAGGCTLGSRTRHWVHTSSPPLRAGRETRARSHTGGRNGSLTLPRNCANCCARGLLDKKLGDMGVAWGHICWWKSLLWVSEKVCFARAA